MTTLAYRAGVLAADSQITYNGSRYSLASKVKKFSNGALLAFSGSPVSGARLFKLVEKGGGRLTENILKKCPDCEALYVTPDGKVFAVRGGDDGGLAPLEGEFFAEGSGFVSALAAMKAGADAVRAIEIACELDTDSALPVLSIQLDPNVVVKRQPRSNPNVIVKKQPRAPRKA